MAFLFPRVEEIRLTRSPLDEVLCEVRFPPILRISREDPSDFQEIIRRQFPRLEIGYGITVLLPQGAIPPPPDIQPRTYRFAKPDGSSSIGLGSSSCSLTTSQYTHWENFLSDLALLANALKSVYSPPYITRLGLRYVNKLTAANTGSSSIADLLALLRAELSALPRCEQLASAREVRSIVALEDEDQKMTLQMLGAAQEENFSVTLDLDCYQEGEFAFEEVTDRVSKLHDSVYFAFRWAVTQELIEKLR